MAYVFCVVSVANKDSQLTAILELCHSILLTSLLALPRSHSILSEVTSHATTGSLFFLLHPPHTTPPKTRTLFFSSLLPSSKQQQRPGYPSPAHIHERSLFIHPTNTPILPLSHYTSLFVPNARLVYLPPFFFTFPFSLFRKH